MDLGLRGRRALVTGGSSGLGLATARALANEGAHVVVSSRSESKLAATGLPYIAADVSDPEQTQQLVVEAAQQLGGLEILIANAGGPPAGNFASTPFENYEMALRLNLLSTIALCQSAIPLMSQSGWGRIVAITSSSVREPIPHLILSNTARAGVTGFLKTLAREVAPRGITVNSLQPGLHRTARLEALYPNAEAMSAAASSIPTGNFGDPDDFGRTAAFLCSDHARFITGASIPLDGGALHGLQ